MPTRKKIDAKKLITMVKEGTQQSELMKAFGFKTSSQFKVAYVNALMESGEAPKIVVGRSSKAVAKEVDKTVSVNSHGSLIIPKALVDHLGMVVGDTFQVKARKTDLTLKKAGAGSSASVQKVVAEKLKVAQGKKG